ncbi:MAG TPA: ABC transporter permease, partial [Candidatus Methylomirabilis sp.]|nr:ABC transporter permease [Candidatus Methylomirabilis sp.]
VHALAGVDLTIEAGEFVALMGASGSGKSTMMNILGCLDRPTAGHYLFDGVNVSELSEPDLARIRSERIGFVFQSFNLLARTSALENVALPLFYADTGPSRRSQRRARARDTLHALRLEDREQNTPSQLSGGQQQRVAIARALINGPSMILADEPTGNLDSRTSNEIMEVLRSLNHEQGVTIVVVTHDHNIAAWTDRIVMMRDGLIVSDEPVPDHERVPSRTGSTVAALPRSVHPSRSLESTGSRRFGASGAFALMILAAAAQAVMRNKLRSILTMLGVFIGVAALIAMVAVGQGANAAVEKEIEGLGTNLLVVLPGATTSNGVRGGHGSASTLTVEDARAIPRDAPAVAKVSYMLRQLGQVEYSGQNWTTNIQGVTPDYLPIANWRISEGRGLEAGDEDGQALVVVLGNTVYHQIFGAHEDPVGATILVKGFALRVIGILASKGQSGWGQDQDDLVMIPFSTAENKILGVAAPSQSQTASNPLFPAAINPFGMSPRLAGKVNSIYVQARGADFVSAAVEQVTDVLQTRHRIQPGTVNDFDVRNLSQIAQAREGSSRIMALLLAAVASISLLVGGIGIMNILLVSVTERTREIGIRMAIGARRVHVLLQFLAEAVLLSAAGGAAGILIGVIISQIISSVAEWPTLVSPAAVLGGFLFSAAVGIFFGYYPARKAALLDPIEALRYE